VSGSSSPADRFARAIRRAATADLGRQLEAGTQVVASQARRGSRQVVLYPLGQTSVVWCAPALARRLAPLNDPTPLDLAGFERRTAALGAGPTSRGIFRVLEGAPARTEGPARTRVLRREDPLDVSLIARFVEQCAPGEVDEAELDLDDLDPAIVALLDVDGEILAYACGRPWSHDGRFDDVGVITRPDARGRGLGSRVVADLAVRQQDRGRMMLYNCDARNLGSNALADSLGFTLVQRVSAAPFG
jgi:GNAT superfamily N-acetyltransferase